MILVTKWSLFSYSVTYTGYINYLLTYSSLLTYIYKSILILVFLLMLQPKDSKVDFVVILCSTCAKMLTGEEPVTEMSAIVVTQGATGDFESVSQVGSNISFPQWEVGTETGMCGVD